MRVSFITPANTAGNPREPTAGGSTLCPLVATVKLASDAAGAAVLTLEQVTKPKALCAYPLPPPVASRAALRQATPETGVARSEGAQRLSGACRPQV